MQCNDCKYNLWKFDIEKACYTDHKYSVKCRLRHSLTLQLNPNDDCFNYHRKWWKLWAKCNTQILLESIVKRLGRLEDESKTDKVFYPRV